MWESVSFEKKFVFVVGSNSEKNIEQFEKKFVFVVGSNSERKKYRTVEDCSIVNSLGVVGVSLVGDQRGVCWLGYAVFCSKNLRKNKGPTGVGASRKKNREIGLLRDRLHKKTCYRKNLFEVVRTVGLSESKETVLLRLLVESESAVLLGV